MSPEEQAKQDELDAIAEKEEEEVFIRLNTSVWNKRKSKQLLMNKKLDLLPKKKRKRKRRRRRRKKRKKDIPILQWFLTINNFIEKKSIFKKMEWNKIKYLKKNLYKGKIYKILL